MAKATRTFRTPFATFTVVSLLGQGGAGRVYRVRDETGIDVAIKVLDPTVDKSGGQQNISGFVPVPFKLGKTGS